VAERRQCPAFPKPPGELMVPPAKTDFLEASPFAKMPGFRDGDFAISDSSAIVHYLEAVKPGPALIPDSPRERARAIWFDEFADTILTAAGTKIFFNRFIMPRFIGQEGDLATAEQAERDELPRVYAYVETQIPESGYLIGDRLTLADIAVVSPIATLGHIGCTIDAVRFPNLAAYSDRILKRESFAKAVEAEGKMIAAMS
jgi:glutathione S-transferase